MLVALLLTVTLSAPFAQQVQHAYAHREADTLRSLLTEADSQIDSLLVRYRLYPLTEDPSVIKDLPADLPNGNARELALLSGLWSYRAGEASIFSAVQYGRRSARLLEQARERDADDPYVLLVEGQSLLFRPAIAGRDPSAAAQSFRQLAEKADSLSGITRIEADVWCWLALKEAGDNSRAEALHQHLLAQNPPPLYQQFLEDPPEV
jgi:hypothetical protein